MTRVRPILTASAGIVGLALAALFIAIVAVAVGGVTVDISRWRDTATERATTALGRPVALHGAFELTLGREAVLRVGEVRILNPPGFTTSEFAALGDARAQFDLLDALRGRLHIRSIEATDVRLGLERTADGRASWSFATASSTPSRMAVEVGEITLRKVAVAYQDARMAKRLAFAFDQFSGSGRWDEPLRLALVGRVANDSTYTLTVAGGPVRQLQEATAPWPFTLDFALRETRLQARGTVDATKGEARFDFDAGAEDLAQIQPLLDTELPRFGAASLQGTVVAAANAIEIVELQGRLGQSELAGHLALAWAARPRVSGDLSFATLDLGPLLPADPATGEVGRERGNMPLRDLVPVDIDVEVRVGQWLGLPVDVRDATLELRADARGVRAPIGATMAGVPFSGQLDLDTAAPMPLLAVRLDAKDAAFGDFERVVGKASGLEGTLGRFGLRAGGRGETLGALVHDLELALAVRDARLRTSNVARGRQIAFTVDEFGAVVRGSERLRGSARGTLQGERATLSFRGGTLADLLRRTTPVELDLAAAGAKLRVEGTLALAEATRETDLTFGLRARRAGDLARWLSIAPDSKLPLSLRGRLRIARDAWHLDDATVKLGRSTLTINAQRDRIDGRPITVAAVRSALIDIPELATLGARTSARGKHRAHIDVPLLPYGIELADADVGLRLERVALGRIDFVDVGFAAHVRGGRLAPSPIAATVAGTPFEGLIALDLRGAVPEATLDLSTGMIDVGALLRKLGVAEDIDGRTDALEVALRAQGSTLRELAQHSSFEARLTGGSIAVRGTADRTVAEIGVQQAIAAVSPGGRLRVHVDGTFDEAPLAIEVASGTLADFAHDATQVSLSVTADAVGAHLALDGEVELPLGRGGDLTLKVSGERLDRLSGLARVELPPWGPWSIRGPIKVTPTGCEVQGLVVSAGESRLTGTGRLDVSGARPRLDVRVTATDIQLDDFPLPERLTDDPPAALTAEGVRTTTRDLARKTERLMSAGFLRRLDVYIDVVVQQVYSGTDRLAAGALRIQVIEGRLYLGPAEVNLPGGTLKLSVAYDPTAAEVDLKAGAYIERFDYGILARRLHHAEGVRGLFSSNIELAGRGPSLDGIMRHADGRIDFAVWPEDVRGGTFNLWSVNLLLAVIPVIDPGGESEVNCIVGRFDLKDGILTDDKIIIDTTRVRVRGAGSANLATEQLAFVFRPRAKGLALFRLQTPLRVNGTLTDYRIGIDRRDLPESILRMLASPVIVPWEWLTLGPLPRDGADVCTDPLRE